MSKLKQISQASSLEQLAEACKNASASLRQDVSDIASQTAQELVFELTMVTPVDTTKALSNWQVGLMYPEVSDKPAYAYGHYGLTAAISRSAAYFAAQAVIAHKQPNTPIYISNNAKYIEELNEGKSKQASAGFVDRAILDAQAKADTALKDMLNGD